MEILVNNQPADIKIENEKTVGEVVAGIEQWLVALGHRLSGLSIDGQAMDVSLLEEAFSREVNTIKTLGIFTSSLAELAVMSLSNLLGDLEEFDSIEFCKRNDFYESWKQTPQAVFTYEQMPDLYDLYTNYFENSGPAGNILRTITEERLKETEAPLEEFSNLHPQLEETCNRLIDLPLDIQTGKDGRAAMTIQLFSGIAEKIFRIYCQFNTQGFIKPDESVSRLISEFNDAVKELLNAYEVQDTVLIGDLAEYEMAPRLMELYNTINHFVSKQEVEIK